MLQESNKQASSNTMLRNAAGLHDFIDYIHSESVDNEVAAASEIDSDIEQKELQHKSLQEDSLHGVKKIAKRKYHESYIEMGFAETSDNKRNV